MKTEKTDKRIKTLLLAVCIVILAFAVVIITAELHITDGTDVVPEKVKSDGVSFLSHLGGIFAKSVADAAETKRFEFILNEEQIEYLVGSAIRENPDLPLTGFDVTSMTEGKVRARVGVKIGFIETVLRISVDGSVTGNVLKLKLDEMEIGKLSDKMVGLILSERRLTEIMEGINFIKLTGERTYAYNLSSLGDVIKPYFAHDFNRELFDVLLDKCLESISKGEVCFGGDGKIGFSLPLDEYEYSAEKYGNMPFDIGYGLILEDMQTLYGNGRIDWGSGRSVLKYLVQGYGYLYPDEQEDVEGVDFHGLSLNTGVERYRNRSSYTGALNVSQFMTLRDLLLRQTEIVLLDVLRGGVVVNLTEENVNGIFARTDIIGTGMCLFNDAESLMTVIGIESVYARITDGVFGLNLIVNVNGFRMVVTGEFKSRNHSDEKLYLQLDTMKLGVSDLSASQSTEILTYLGKIFEGQTWMTFDTVKSEVCFDFTETLTRMLIFDSNVSAYLRSHLYTETSLRSYDGGIMRIVIYYR